MVTYNDAPINKPAIAKYAARVLLIKYNEAPASINKIPIKIYLSITNEKTESASTPTPSASISPGNPKRYSTKKKERNTRVEPVSPCN